MAGVNVIDNRFIHGIKINQERFENVLHYQTISFKEFVRAYDTK